MPLMGKHVFAVYRHHHQSSVNENATHGGPSTLIRSSFNLGSGLRGHFPLCVKHSAAPTWFVIHETANQTHVASNFWIFWITFLPNSHGANLIFSSGTSGLETKFLMLLNTQRSGKFAWRYLKPMGLRYHEIPMQTKNVQKVAKKRLADIT